MKDKRPIAHDEETIKQLDQELRELAKKPDFLVQISPIAAWCFILQIQLVSRHPVNKNWTFDHVRNLAKELELELELSDWLKDYTDKGWNPELDRASDPTGMGIVIRADDYVLNNLALGVACQMLLEQSNGSSLQQLAEDIQEIANDQLDQLTSTQIANAVAEFKKAKL